MRKILLIISLLASSVSFAQNINNDMMCSSEYSPVCAHKTLYCIKAPCPQPDPQTYTNSCQAKIDGAKILYNGTCEKAAKDLTITSPYLASRVNRLQTHLINYQNSNSLTDEKIAQILQSGIEKIENILMTSRLLPGKYAQLQFQKKVFEYTKNIFENN